MAPELSPCIRHITTHNADGKSVYAQSPVQTHFSAGSVSLARSWSVANIPANLKNDEDMKAYVAGQESVTSHQRMELVLPTEGVRNNGANLLLVQLLPGGYTAMHQTVSIDYSICVVGTVIHELDGGERVILRPGDHIVQRGTNHRWINASTTEPAKFFAVTLPCVPFDIGGKPLEEIHLPDGADYSPESRAVQFSEVEIHPLRKTVPLGFLKYGAVVKGMGIFNL